MTSAELKTMREALGLTVGWLAEQAGVGERTVRYWESGRNQVPDDVAELIGRIEARSRELVRRAVTTVSEVSARSGGTPEAVDLRRYGSDAELWKAHREFRPLPVTWHASVLARIARELEAQGIPSTIEYAQ